MQISGSGTSANVVAGDLIGTDITGTVALGNGLDGVEINTSASSNTIGGTIAGAGNVISGNASDGVEIDEAATANLVIGDLIGTDVTGTVAVGNLEGVVITGSNNTIGGTAAGAGNLISGNGSAC